MAAEDQVGLQRSIQLRAMDVVVEPEPVAVLVVEDGSRLVRLLVARREDTTAVDLERERDRIERVAGQRVGG